MDTTSTRNANCLRLLRLAVSVLLLRVTVGIVWKYRDYLPPDFESDFLSGRQGYFFGPYRWAFYLHLATGPVALLNGQLLLSDRFRTWQPRWHLRLGRVHVGIVLCGVVPSGLWMARHAEPGLSAAIAFATLSVLTGVCTALGWRAAVRRRFISHREWMWRSWLALCSAVVLRVMVGLAMVLDLRMDWIDSAIPWACWLLPLGVFEVHRLARTRRFRSHTDSQGSRGPR